MSLKNTWCIDILLLKGWTFQKMKKKKNTSLSQGQNVYVSQGLNLNKDPKDTKKRFKIIGKNHYHIRKWSKAYKVLRFEGFQQTWQNSFYVYYCVALKASTMQWRLNELLLSSLDKKVLLEDRLSSRVNS